jgi:lipopolysaccharide export system protein LptA
LRSMLRFPQKPGTRRTGADGMSMERRQCGPTTGIAVMLRSCALAMVVALPALAETQTVNIPNALQGFSTNRDQPIDIKSASLEIRDKDKLATFRENVRVVNGDTTLKCDTMTVEYEHDGVAQDGKPPPIRSNDAQQIKRIDVEGGVVVARKDQTATADSGVFDMRANTATLTGNVVVSEGECVVRAERLTVDLQTGVSRFENTTQVPPQPDRCTAAESAQ